MRSPKLPLALLLCLCFGCKKNAPPRAEDLRGRFEAATQINSSQDRDEALKAVAVDAAGLGAGDVVKQALGAMNSSALRDETASDCALQLSKDRHSSMAKEVAQSINSSGLRDSTLKKVAKGS
jgi:hypothetical protein